MTVSPVVQEKVVTSLNDVPGPDFYWKYRLDRLVSKKGSELQFQEANYPEVTGFKDLYYSYYLDLSFQNKLVSFDVEAEQQVTDEEWLKIFKSICQWSSKAASKNKFDPATLPSNDFELVKMLYPNANMRELEEPLKEEEYGVDFPYKNLKDMYSAARKGTLSIPGYSTNSPENYILDVSEARQALAELKERTLAELDATLEECKALVLNPFPDETARIHYQKLRERLAALPQSDEEWVVHRARKLALVEEMATVVSRRVPEEQLLAHEHHEEEHASSSPPIPTPAEDLQTKYGKNIEVLAQDFAKFKNNPTGYLETFLTERVGKTVSDVWKRTIDLQKAETKHSELDMVQAMKEVLNSA